MLELDNSHQNNQPGELNNSLTSFIFSISDGTKADSGKTDYLSLLNKLPPS